MVFPFLVILPGMIAGVVTSSKMHDASAKEGVATNAAIREIANPKIVEARPIHK